MANSPKLKVTLVKSLLGRPGTQGRVARALGFKRTNQTLILSDTPTIRGMVQKISHLLTVEVA